MLFGTVNMRVVVAAPLLHGLNTGVFYGCVAISAAFTVGWCEKDKLFISELIPKTLLSAECIVGLFAILNTYFSLVLLFVVRRMTKQYELVKARLFQGAKALSPQLRLYAFKTITAHARRPEAGVVKDVFPAALMRSDLQKHF